MKVKVVVIGASLGLLEALLASGCAHEQRAINDSGTYPNRTNGAYLTGSNLPQNVQRNGPVTNGKDNVRIIDRSDMNQSGGADVNQTLRQLGVTP
ncbi:MAG TPA: hypothetical protein VFE51_23810 [Verrucomicrobiae bacterium]|nr:hypothetical protein [Verrucomicrobiae bacterium]